MFQFLFIFGPAAITYMTVQKLSRHSAPNWYSALIELICYATADAAITTLGLVPFDKVEFILMPNGIRNIQYGKTAFFSSIIVGAAVGIIISFFKKHGEVRIEIEAHTEDKEHEEEK